MSARVKIRNELIGESQSGEREGVGGGDVSARVKIRNELIGESQSGEREGVGGGVRAS